MVGKIKICKEAGCQNSATTKGYCRLHYLRHWKDLKEEEQSKAAKRLNNYIDGICQKHSDRYIEAIKKDISSGDEWENRDIDDNYASGVIESILDDLGFNDEIQIDRLVSKIKIDESF